MRSWDGHCPECGSDTIDLQYVTTHALRKRCAECGHRWNEPREPEVLTVTGWVNGQALNGEPTLTR